MRILLLIILVLFFAEQVMAASLSDTYQTKVKHGQYSTATQEKLNNKVDITDSRLTDARPPTAHNQAASTITGLATVATTGSFPDLINTPPFTRGYDGREIEVQNSGTHIQWRYIETPPAAWNNLVALVDITGSNGLDGDNFICTITGGIRTITYDKNGSNPSPAMVAFGVEYRINGSVVTPETYSWTVPASDSLLSGSASGATFTPTVTGTFSAGSADNRVDVTVTYAGKTCTATAPVPITKTGADGAAANPENKQQLYTRVGAATTGDVLNTECGPGDAATFAGRTVRATGGDIHRTDLCGGQTWVHARPSDSAGAMKLGVKDSNGNPLSYFKKEGDLVVKGTLVIQ